MTRVDGNERCWVMKDEILELKAEREKPDALVVLESSV
jgi:hypothetical protein